MSFAAKSQRAAPSGGQAKTAVRAGGPAKIASRVRDVVDGPGELLDPATRDFMELRFGHSFGAVRVHADGRAADSARAVNAAAYTVGPHIVFGGGAYAPQSAAGRRLLAHELAHVVQQSRGGTRAPAPLAGGALERWGAPPAAAAMGSGAGLVAVSGRSGVGLARDARSLHGTVVPSELSNDELEQETYLVQEWLSANAHSGEEGEHMLQALQQLEAEAAKRSAKPEQPKAPLLPSVHSGDSAILASVMRQIDGIRPSEVASGLFTMELEGQRKDLTGDQVARIKREATNVLKDHLRQILTKAEGAQAGYDAQTETDKKHWIVAPIVKTLGRIKDPGPYLTGDVARARALVARAKDAMAAGSFAQGAEALAGAETSAVSAEKLWQAYFEGIIGAGEMTVTGLEITRDAAFITLGVLATIATAGAAAGATTTALGVEVGTATAANTIATAAPVLAGLAEAGSKVALGDPVDWGALAVDTVAQLVLARFGGKLTGGMTKAILGKAGRGLSRVVVEKAVHTAIFHVSSTLLMTAAQDAYRALKSGGKNITWEFFANDVIRRLTDPKGLAVAAITGTLTVGAEVKFGGGASPAVGTGAPATEGAGGQGAPRSASAPAVESPPPAAPNPEPIPAHGGRGKYGTRQGSFARADRLCGSSQSGAGAHPPLRERSGADENHPQRRYWGVISQGGAGRWHPPFRS
jgi:hypothetical protein